MERRRRKGLSSSLDDAGKYEFADISSIHNSTANGSSVAGGYVGNNTTAAAYLRQKRNSWWNIFVPENLKQRFVLFIFSFYYLFFYHLILVLFIFLRFFFIHLFISLIKSQYISKMDFDITLLI